MMITPGYVVFGEGPLGAAKSIQGPVRWPFSHPRIQAGVKCGVRVRVGEREMQENDMD